MKCEGSELRRRTAIRVILICAFLVCVAMLFLGPPFARVSVAIFNALVWVIIFGYLGRAFFRAWRRMKAETRHREPRQQRCHREAAVGPRPLALFAVIAAGASPLFLVASHPTFVADCFANVAIAAVVAVLILLLARAVEKGAWLAAAVAIFVPVTMLYAGLSLAIIVGVVGIGGSILPVVAFAGLLVTSLVVSVLLIRAALAEPRLKRRTSEPRHEGIPG